MRFQAPKAIINHPAVQECCDAEVTEDYKYDVLLKDGWSFNYGRMSGCGTGFFKTVADFLKAEPVNVPANGGRPPGTAYKE